MKQSLEYAKFTPNSEGVEGTFQNPIWQVEELTPENLASVNSDYRKFKRAAELIYVREDLSSLEGQKIAIAFLSPSTGGKTAISASVCNLLPQHVDIIQTTTTRPRRVHESENAYLFISKEEFTHLKEQGDFIESVEQGRQEYGTQTSELKKKIETGKPILIWPGELQGAQELKKWMEKEYPQIPFLLVFILPNISFAELATRIGRQRDLTEVIDWRIERALWEIEEAGRRADIVLLNPNDSSKLPKKAIKTMVSVICGFLERLEN